MIQKPKFTVSAVSLFGVLLLTFFFNYPRCLAENIYYKDGRIIKAQIVNRTKDTIWVQQGEGAIGIDAQEISKIINPDGTVSKYDVGYLVAQIQDLLKEKKYMEAEKNCTSLLQVSPDNVNVRYLRGMLNQKIGNTAKAIEDYSFLITHKDADGAIFNNLGTINARSNQYNAAEDLFYKAINCNPKRVEFHKNLSELFMSLKNYDRAIEEYNNVLNLEPDNLVALFNLGVIYKEKGDYKQAGKQWQRALAVKPNDRDAKKALLSLGDKK